MKKKLFASVLCIAMGVILLAGCKSRGDNGNAFCSKKLKQRYGRADRRVQ